MYMHMCVRKAGEQYTLNSTEAVEQEQQNSSTSGKNLGGSVAEVSPFLCRHLDPDYRIEYM